MVAHGQVVTLEYRGQLKVIGRVVVDREDKHAIYAWPEKWLAGRIWVTLAPGAGSSLRFAKFAWEVRES